MGKYISNINGEWLPSAYKADFILAKLPGSVIIPEPTEWREGLVCVVQHYEHDAAAFAYNEREFAYLKHDNRQRTWLFVPNARQYAK